METNSIPTMNMETGETGCCPRFDPKGWDGLTLTFRDKPFVRATTKSLLHVPINMGSVFARVQKHIEDAEALDPDNFLVLSRDLSATAAEHLFSVTKDVPGEDMTRVSGRFMTRVFEGSYRNVKNWHHDMEVAAEAAGEIAGKVYMFYTTCPKCARAFGRNFVVGLVEI